MVNYRGIFMTLAPGSGNLAFKSYNLVVSDTLKPSLSSSKTAIKMIKPLDCLLRQGENSLQIFEL
jgi:hypothetical protein